ncbi:MAG: ABC transporter substrate-binding protein [Treponema sp.]|nr:ABC transporter substrate-binding protein [Treponema sp.]
MKKRVFVIALLLLLCGTLVFATGGRQGSASGTPTLTWWCIGGSPNNLGDALKVIGDYTQSRINARLDIKVAGWADAGQRFQTIVNSGEYYDIMFTDSGNYNRFVSMGAFEDLTNRLATDAPELQRFVPNTLWDGVRINGRIYSVPTYKDSSKTNFMIWDDVIVRRYNLDITRIHTFAELDRAFRTIKAGEGSRYYPLQLARGSRMDVVFNDDYDSLLIGLPPVGAGTYDKNRKVVSVFEQPEVMERLRYLHRWYNDGIINPDAPVQQETPTQRPFFVAQGWPAAASIWQTNSGVEKYNLEKLFGPSYSTDSIQGSMNAISSNSRYKTESLKMLELINTDRKMRDMLAYGIEGTNFTYVRPTVVRLLSADQWNLARYQQGTFFNMSTIEGESEEAWDQVRQQNEQATPAELLGFVFNNSSVINEIANCRAVYDRYSDELLTGASNPDVAVPAMMRDLYAAGFQKIIDEAQRQVNAFKR